MNKKYTIISLSLIAILGSLFVALATNMFFSDMINIQAGFAHATNLTTLPAISVALSLVLATFFVIRTYKHPDCFKKISFLYLILLVAFNFIGLLSAILAIALIYKSLTPGFLIILMVLNIILLGGGVVGFIFLRKANGDEGQIKITFKYVLKTVGWFFYILLAYNRFGTFLMAPTYVYLRNLFMTFPFYLWLLTPMYLGVLEALYIFDILDKKKLFLLTVIGLGVNAILVAYSIIIGVNDSSFVASLSQTMMVERMISKPIEIIIHFLSYLGVGAVLIVQSKKA